MKKTIFIAAIVAAIISSGCSKYITPDQAANGKARCGRGVR